MSVFTNNGGYVVKKETIYPYANNIRYMDCSCGTQVRNVGEEATSVVCNRCLTGQMFEKFPEMVDDFNTKQYKPTGRPAGWHFMNEFVDKDGNVFHKGKEQPKLFGTLKSTKVQPKKKTKRRTKEQILIARHKKKQAALKKAKLSKN